MNIVLYQPEIPQNTGNIARTCVVTGSRLHLIKPLGFSVSEKQVKRAGLDYWELLDLIIYNSFDEFLANNDSLEIYPITTHAKKLYTEVDYSDDAYFLFGKESAGLPKEIHEIFFESRVRIPMINHEKARSLNLSNAVSIVIYEALRQKKFTGVE